MKQDVKLAEIHFDAGIVYGPQVQSEIMIEVIIDYMVGVDQYSGKKRGRGTRK